MFQVIPRELAFFELFDRAAEGVERGATELMALVDDLGRADAHARTIEDLEHEGDDLTHEIIGLLNTTFVVPIDRHDIQGLASSLDDVLDHIEAIADLLSLHKLRAPLPDFRLQVDVLLRISGLVRKAVRGLHDVRHLDPAVAEIKRLEREGDFIFRRAVAGLFAGDHRAMDVLIWKDLVDEAEAAIDRCEDIANSIESVHLKYA
jgi:uncharacterized protein